MFLDGYGEQVLMGTWETIKLALCSLLVAFILGLLGALGKLFGNRFFYLWAQAYTTLIRSIPDLVLMLLIFFGIQQLLNSITDCLGLAQFDLDPFITGVLTIGFIYGAYFAETFRGAFLAVPKGQLEAGKAYGFTPKRIFSRILFPQMMRYALPGIGNNWLVVLKATALVSIIGLSDLVQITQSAGRASGRMFFFILIAGMVYLALTTISNVILWWLEKKYSVGVREANI
ncbi:histidine/lysine/arginine/ornithine ABC transporter permease HisQ [Pelistega indica]|uniref:Histidine/lysine/arginine/ornithine ABC transporter permease HisQ n=1 Tax=Pelistega indica TaxID=1414851 RepID=V8G467_9BURK|nr:MULTISPECIES: histidine ABC transporter permease HisQ [Pelistega]ETD70753.1 histidine/lysine/arginine/ornithine ABC transporter permease HisQ [Pelistega indica]